MSAIWLYITDHGNVGVAHALCHVTLSLGVQNNHSYEIFDPYLPIHYATFMRLWWRSRGVLRGAMSIPIVKRFLGENFVPSKMIPKMVLIRADGSLNIRFYVRSPEKAHHCAEPRVLAYFASKSVQGLGWSELQEPNKLTPLVCKLARKVTHAVIMGWSWRTFAQV